MSVRKATHAGSWYSAKGHDLNKQLAGWLTHAGMATMDGDPLPIDGLRAIIAPHAGYSYSGPAAGYAYKCIQPESFKRVFILGPSHHVYLPGCALSKCLKYNTPLGDLIIDQRVNRALEKTGQFGFMAQDTDEDEHSIEMHLPYIYKVFEDHLEHLTIIPILIGALNESTEQQFGKLLAPYLDDPENLFIVSSDFCHWGNRFQYTYYASNSGAVTPSLMKLTSGGRKQSPDEPKIFESIRRLDEEGMREIESQDHAAFCKYLSRTRNTICGRHPIGVLMAALEEHSSANNSNKKKKKKTTTTTPTRTNADVEANGENLKEHQHQESGYRIRFVHYAQSSSALTTSDSSVSYASAFVQHQQH